MLGLEVALDTTAIKKLLQRSLPPPQAPPAEQQAALTEWSQRLRLPMALDDAQGLRVRRQWEGLLRQDQDRPIPGLYFHLELPA